MNSFLTSPVKICSLLYVYVVNVCENIYIIFFNLILYKYSRNFVKGMGFESSTFLLPGMNPRVCLPVQPTPLRTVLTGPHVLHDDLKLAIPRAFGRSLFGHRTFLEVRRFQRLSVVRLWFGQMT